MSHDAASGGSLTGGGSPTGGAPQAEPGLAPAGAAAPEDFDALVADILENPERILKEDLSPEQILAIQKRLNPYAGVAGAPPVEGRKKVVVCSYTNLREDYISRFRLTSLVGFLFQMFHEWEVPAEARRWVPGGSAAKKRAEGAPGDSTAQPFALDAVVERLRATLAIAEEAQAADKAAQEGRRQALAADAALADGAPAAERAKVAELYKSADTAAAKAAGLLYAATHAVHRHGADAEGRLRATAEAGMKHPEVREVLKQFPLPPPPGQVEMPAAKAKDIIGGFLRNWFAFDPSVHVRSGHDAKVIAAAVEKVQVGDAQVAVDAKDPGHLPLESVRAAAPKPAPEHADAVRRILDAQSSYNAVVALLRDEGLLEAALVAVENADTFRHYLLPVRRDSAARPAADQVPPQDTFHRWNYYTEVNYEELRTITEALYPERPDLDWAIAPWEVFEGTDREVDEAFEKFCQRYQEEIPSALKSLEFGSWAILADFKGNRKKIQFYNKHTDVLKRILDRHAEDKRIGAELMRNRVRQTKAQNIASEGPDAPGLSKYRRDLAQGGQDLSGKGVERVISSVEMKRLEKARGNIKAAQELELLEQTEKKLAELEEREKLHKEAGKSLPSADREELTRIREDIGRIREMAAVPDDAIQVDIFQSDPSAGTFTKSHFYTKAEAPEHLAESQRTPQAAEAGSSHPAVVAHSPPPQPQGVPQPSGGPPRASPAAAFAPFAVEHMMQGPRSEAERHRAAVQDAARGEKP